MMATVFKSAMDQVKADNELKQKTRTALLSDKKPARGWNPMMRRVVVAACAAVFVCGTTIGAYAYYKTPASYLSLDINPSVELGVNHFGKVVSAEAYNEDGETILDGQSVMGSTVKDAVSTLVKSADEKGFIADDGSTVVSVTAETDDSGTAAELEETAAQGADEAVKSEGDTATIQKDNVALERRAEAQKLGITPGKLNLIQKLQALDPNATVDQYKDAKVKDIMKQIIAARKANKAQSDSSVSSENESQTGTDSAVASKAQAQAANPDHSTAKTESQQNKGKSNQTKGNKITGSTAQTTSNTVSSLPSDNSQTVSAPAASTSHPTVSSQTSSRSNNGQGAANSHASGNKKK